MILLFKVKSCVIVHVFIKYFMFAYVSARFIYLSQFLLKAGVGRKGGCAMNHTQLRSEATPD